MVMRNSVLYSEIKEREREKNKKKIHTVPVKMVVCCTMFDWILYVQATMIVVYATETTANTES